MGIGGAVKDALTRDGARGASTITQQLAKNMFHVRNKEYSGLLGKIPGLRMLIAKAKEFVSYTQSTRLTVEQDIQQHHLLEDEGFRANPHKMVFELEVALA